MTNLATRCAVNEMTMSAPFLISRSACVIEIMHFLLMARKMLRTHSTRRLREERAVGLTLTTYQVEASSNGASVDDLVAELRVLVSRGCGTGCNHVAKIDFASRARFERFVVS